MLATVMRPLWHVARAVRRKVRRHPLRLPRLDITARRPLESTRYGDDFRVFPRPRTPPDNWPDAPKILNPSALLHPELQSRSAPRVYDLDLFETLNVEYEANRVVREAPRYDAATLDHRSRGRILSIHNRIDLLGKAVLEVGCGSGMEVWYMARYLHAEAWGIDIQPRRAWPLLSSDKVHLVAGDMARANGLPSGKFDRAISSTVWEHIEQPYEALQELYRVLKPGGIAWIRASLYRGPTASHLARDINFPFPHLLFTDQVIAEGLTRLGREPRGAAWVNRLTWEQYETYLEEIGFLIKALWFDRYPLDAAFYERFQDVLGRYPRRDLERGFFTVIVAKGRGWWRRASWPRGRGNGALNRG